MELVKVPSGCPPQQGFPGQTKDVSVILSSPSLACDAINDLTLWHWSALCPFIIVSPIFWIGPFGLLLHVLPSLYFLIHWPPTGNWSLKVQYWLLLQSSSELRVLHTYEQVSLFQLHLSLPLHCTSSGYVGQMSTQVLLEYVQILSELHSFSSVISLHECLSIPNSLYRDEIGVGKHSFIL